MGGRVKIRMIAGGGGEDKKLLKVLVIIFMDSPHTMFSILPDIKLSSSIISNILLWNFTEWTKRISSMTWDGMECVQDP